MNCPKYIRELLERRAKLASDFISVDSKIVNWLNVHEILVSDDDIRTGAESIVNPYASIYRILDAIEDA